MFYMKEANYSINDFCKKQWLEIYEKIAGGVVFIEDCLTECLHWNGGLSSLFEKGAVAVKSLSPFESGERNQRKAIFICRGQKVNLNTIKSILSDSSFVHCSIAITVNSEVIQFENDEIANLEELVISWISKKPCSVDIFYIPLFTVSITNNVFMTPIYSGLFPKFGDSLQAESPTNVDLHSLPLEDKNEVRRLASNFNSLLEYMNAKEDIYFMGPFSSIIAGVLEYLPAAETRRKNASNNVSIIFIDRTLDLSAVSSHTSECALDKVMSVLPRFPGHSLDIAVDMSPLCEANVVSLSEDLHLCPGCLCHAENEQSMHMITNFVNKSQQEVLLGLYGKLSNLNISTPTRLPPRVSVQNLEKLVNSTKGKYDVIYQHSELLQQCLAIVQTMKSPATKETDLLMSLEQQIVQNLSTSRDSTSVLTQISLLIKNRKQRGLTLERLLSLLVYLYSTASCEVAFSNAQEKQLVDALQIALSEDREILALNYLDGEQLKTDEGCAEFAVNLLTRLKDVAASRKLLVKYKSVIKITDSISPTEYKGVTQQLINDLTNIEKPEIPDLKSRTDKLKGLLRSGLNILMSTATKKASAAAKHPFDNPLVIIYIVGGTSAEECRTLHQAVMTSGSDTEVWIGSTTFMNPVEAMRHALFLNVH